MKPAQRTSRSDSPSACKWAPTHRARRRGKFTFRSTLQGTFAATDFAPRERGLGRLPRLGHSDQPFFCLLFGLLSAWRREEPKTETEGTAAFSRFADSSR